MKFYVLPEKLRFLFVFAKCLSPDSLLESMDEMPSSRHFFSLYKQIKKYMHKISGKRAYLSVITG